MKPRTIPPMTAPRGLPSPPTPSRRIPTRTALRPMVGETVPFCATRRKPAQPANKPLTANAPATTRFARTPRSRAIGKSSAAARIWIPRWVRRRKSASETSSTHVSPTVNTSRLRDVEEADLPGIEQAWCEGDALRERPEDRSWRGSADRSSTANEVTSSVRRVRVSDRTEGDALHQHRGPRRPRRRRAAIRTTQRCAVEQHSA